MKTRIVYYSLASEQVTVRTMDLGMQGSAQGGVEVDRVEHALAIALRDLRDHTLAARIESIELRTDA